MIATDRLLLRPWRADEIHLLAGWNADPVVTRHFGRTRSPAEVAARFRQMQEWQEERGFSFWAVERRADGALIGNCGLKPIEIAWSEPSDIEIGWLLAPDAWGQGYAREAAAAALAFGLGLAPRVIALIAETNQPSVSVAEAIGMARASQLDFDHPDVPEGPFRRHLVFAKAR